MRKQNQAVWNKFNLAREIVQNQLDEISELKQNVNRLQLQIVDVWSKAKTDALNVSHSERDETIDEESERSDVSTPESSTEIKYLAESMKDDKKMDEDWNPEMDE
eukprot:166025_1